MGGEAGEEKNESTTIRSKERRERKSIMMNSVL
jgi:hypothetical protein